MIVCEMKTNTKLFSVIKKKTPIIEGNVEGINYRGRPRMEYMLKMYQYNRESLQTKLSVKYEKKKKKKTTRAVNNYDLFGNNS